MYYPRHKKCKIYQAYLHQSISPAKIKRIEVNDFILPFNADNKREGW